ncbi:MAG: hypothetical protein HY340_04160 [Candidatus Kerfeldbacteria bacterium]|nr:hypothetical protein [Candidatus Kerfeldbacteria bacterium]
MRRLGFSGIVHLTTVVFRGNHRMGKRRSSGGDRFVSEREAEKVVAVFYPNASAGLTTGTIGASVALLQFCRD